MVVYIVLGALCVIYDACYFSYNIKKKNVSAAMGAALIFVLTLVSIIMFSITMMNSG